MLRFLMLLCSLWFWFIFSIVKAYGQGETCTNPILISPCPSVAMTAVSTAGMGNDQNATYYNYSMKGNDIVFKVTPPSGNTNVLVSISNLSANAFLIASNSACSVPYSVSNYLYPGSTFDNRSFYATSTYPLYITIDHNNLTDITFDISFGSLGASQYVSIPDTRGSWQQATGCIAPITKPSMNVKWNGVRQAVPMTLSPLSVQGTMCITPYLKNLTGKEGVKSISFTFDPDLSSPLPTVTQMNGFYNAGTWNAVKVGPVITWTFTDAAGLGRGDFTGTPNNCLAYEFCFTFTPLSNNPTRTNINLFLRGDGFGTGYSYYTYSSGCCSSANASCMLGFTGSGTANGSSMGMGINDPPLPVELLSFEATEQNDQVLLDWTTALEINSDHFEVLRSLDGSQYESIAQVAALGRASSYSYIDSEALTGIRYYKLKSVDKDGQFAYTDVRTIQNARESEVRLYPVPAENVVTIAAVLPISEYTITDIYGNTVAHEKLNDVLSYEIPVQSFTKGIYIIRVRVLDQIYVRQLIRN